MHTIIKSIAIFVTAALALNAMAPALAQAENTAPSEVVDWYLDERARQVIVAEGRYVEVTYRGAYGETEIAEGFVRPMDETKLVIYQTGYRKTIKTISRDKIDVLIVCDNRSQLQHAKRIIALGNKKRDEGRLGRIAKKLFVGSLVGGFLGLSGGLIGGVAEDARSNCSDEFFGCIGGVMLGASIGYTAGVALGVSKLDPYDQPVKTMLGSLMGLGVGILSVRLNAAEEYWPALLIGPSVGAVIMSERSRNTLTVRRFSIGLAPDRNGNVSAIATLRF